MSASTDPSSHRVRRDGSREQFWRQMLGQFAASGKSIRAFCAARGLSEPSFYSWRHTLAARDAAAPRPRRAAGATEAATFLPVRLSKACDNCDSRGAGCPEMAGTMEIVLAGGRCIRLRGPVDRAALAEVVATLEGQPFRLEGSRSADGKRAEAVS